MSSEMFSHKCQISYQYHVIEGFLMCKENNNCNVFIFYHTQKQQCRIGQVVFEGEKIFFPIHVILHIHKSTEVFVPQDWSY